jgi:hypothetical protein
MVRHGTLRPTTQLSNSGVVSSFPLETKLLNKEQYYVMTGPHVQAVRNSRSTLVVTTWQFYQEHLGKQMNSVQIRLYEAES